jgi:hypothetical protein
MWVPDSGTIPGQNIFLEINFARIDTGTFVEVNTSVEDPAAAVFRIHNVFNILRPIKVDIFAFKH